MNEKYILKQATEQDIEDMCNRSEFTWEGMSTDPDNLEQIADLLIQEKEMQAPITMWTWNGDMFNTMYGLTGTNAYPDDLTFLGIDDFYDPMAKLQWGARWLDDIVDNNRRRQGEMD